MEKKGETRVVVDTDIFVDFLRGVPAAKDFFEKKSQILFSAITETELLSGTACNDARKREDLLHFLSQYVKIVIDNPLAQLAGDLRRAHSVTTPDSIIAATALLYHASLVTRDRAAFEQFKEIEILVPY